MTLFINLKAYGLHDRGSIELDDKDRQTCKIADQYRFVGLVGNIGSSYWATFSRSAEFADGRPHPLDRWSQRVAGEIERQYPVTAIFPFDGPPYYPFQQWAKRAESIEPSPLGLLIHPDYGLWHSYRFALLMESPSPSMLAPAIGRSPCRDCHARPCLSRCPVSAFSDDGYDVDRCATYLRQHSDANCHQQGCLARDACPAAPSFRYRSAQSRFHLQAFLTARAR